jgi:hypothetical protein
MKSRLTLKGSLIWILIGAIIIAGLWYFFKIDRHFLTYQSAAKQPPIWGITFSKSYTEELGLDWRQAYLAMLDDLQVRHIRIPVYWSDIERTENSLDYADYDWMISEGAKRHVQFIIAIGQRLPRWPECHLPGWAVGLPQQNLRDRELSMITQTVKHFQSEQAIVSWQAENEYFVDWFGSCSKGDKDYLAAVVRTIRQLDPSRAIMLTDSGEFSTWGQVSQLTDTVGTTMYRVAWNPHLGYTYTPWPAWLYRLKASWRHLDPAKTVVAELQAEPWPTAGRSMSDLTAAEIDSSFPIQQLYTNAELARRTQFAGVYFWGAEWWYARLLRGDDSYWNAAKQIIRGQQ